MSKLIPAKDASLLAGLAYEVRADQKAARESPLLARIADPKARDIADVILGNPSDDDEVKAAADQIIDWADRQ
jgi:hypothetical protein